MAETESPYSQTDASPLTGPSSLGSTFDAQGLPTVHEVPQHKATYIDNGCLDKRLLSAGQPTAGSREASIESSFGQSYHEKPIEETSRRLRHTGPPRSKQDEWRRSDSPSINLNNGAYTPNNGNFRHSTLDAVSQPPNMKKDKKGGFRNTLRRMFSRKSTRNTINVPNTKVYPQHVCTLMPPIALVKLTILQDPDEFITSATDVKATRSTSLPTQGFMRTSGLSSHPPQNNIPQPPPLVAERKASPPQPIRLTPERPARPRRASVPSLIFNREEIEAVEAAMTGLGLQNAPEQAVDTQNIGFAVTNGSNPRRRSRSVGAFRDTEHRMSPIQWRRWRRRSDEIKYWRESTDLTSLGFQVPGSPSANPKEEANIPDKDDRNVDEHNGEFNFGLPGDTMQDQERIGLEERIVTLEIKLMDFEYAISKLQAGSMSPSRRHSQFKTTGQESVDNYSSSDRSHAPIRASPSMAQSSPPASPSKFTHDTTPEPRPTSVATTLRPRHSGYTAHHKVSIDHSTHSSLATLTIDHYTTLITLIRHEQSARLRLEQQVSMLQGRLDHISAPQSSHSLANSISPHSHSRSLSSQHRRQGFIETTPSARAGASLIRPPRSRSRSSVYDTETDTDDDQYHDVYATPGATPVEKERGEYERGAFDRVEVAEGVAF